MSGIKIVDKVEYTGKFKVGDEVKFVAFIYGASSVIPERIIGEVGTVGNVQSGGEYPYNVKFGDTKYWFNEAELELVEGSGEIKRNDDALDALRYSIDKINRPASSHYHTNNNGNDVWNFADDNLSKERVKGFHQINAIKYVSRYNKKHDSKEKRIEDLKKAKVSIDKLIELERKSMNSKGCDVVEE